MKANNRIAAFLRKRPTFVISGELRPRRIPCILAGRKIGFTTELFRHVVSLALGYQDPRKLDVDPQTDFVRCSSASPEGCRIRVNRHRIRQLLEGAFKGEFGAGVGMALLTYDKENRRYEFHSSLRIQLCPELLDLPHGVLSPPLTERVKAWLKDNKPKKRAG